ncbi:MAG: type IV pilus assembly protein PilM [Candidatus Falkowbacteria bacterium]|nr:type IV pilus assembly protein PilM [Candidatus Falkowbacteria bacterium]
MEIFKSSLQSYLGIDINASSVKVVELKKHGNKVALATYGFSEHFSEVMPKESAPLDIRKSSDLIKSICQKAHTSTNLALASLPTFSVFSSIININNSVNKKDIEAAINWEAKKVIPLPLQDIVIDWQMVDEAAATAGGHKVLLTGAPKNLIQNYVGIFKTAQLNLLSLETEIFALIRSLVGNDRSSIMIVQLGSTTTNIFVVDKTVPVINRSIAVGGINITQSVASHLNMTLAQAEQFKYDLMYNGEGENIEKLPAMIIEAFNPIVNEIKYILEVFGNKDNRRVEKIILTGGGALLPGLTNYLSEEFNLNVIVGDPWFRVAYPFELKPILDKIGPRLAVAIGLAMREFDHK